jgi:hypothetical protein
MKNVLIFTKSISASNDSKKQVASDIRCTVYVYPVPLCPSYAILFGGSLKNIICKFEFIFIHII